MAFCRGKDEGTVMSCENEEEGEHDHKLLKCKQLSEINFEWGSTSAKDAVYQEALETGNLRAAMNWIRQCEPRRYVLRREQVESSLRRDFQLMSQMNPRAKRKFVIDFKNLDKPMLFKGWTGTGKTQCALDHFNYPLLVSMRESLQELAPLTDGIVFDSMPFHDWPAESFLQLLDITNEAVVQVEYGRVIIPAKMPRIFTAIGGPEKWWPSKANDEQVKEIRRRLEIFNFDENVY